MKEWFDTHVIQPLSLQVEEFKGKGSGLTLSQILSMIINMNQYQPMHRSSFIYLPSYIEMKRACVNVDYNDNRCFMGHTFLSIPRSRSSRSSSGAGIPYEFKKIDFFIFLK